MPRLSNGLEAALNILKRVRLANSAKGHHWVRPSLSLDGLTLWVHEDSPIEFRIEFGIGGTGMIMIVVGGAGSTAEQKVRYFGWGEWVLAAAYINQVASRALAIGRLK